MSILPKVARCPCCEVFNFVHLDAVTYNNEFQGLLNGWKIKKKFNCRGCKEELGLFVHGANLKKKVIWLSMLKCEEGYYDKLDVLEKRRTKLAKIANKKYYETLKEIKDIENQIRLDKIKLKIKFKIQNKELLHRHVH